ncbi:MAG: 30S ribosomal protein S6 [Candidatus Zixiibacteriota bacterium]|nr:MAG: 30S ribosomal protein S6 [candidate division Zixibacteria bacterium]
MNLYETTFIINPQTDDATIDRRVKDVAELIAQNQGKILYEDHMGTRRLAYEINGLTQGYYASFVFEAPTSVLPVLNRHYKLNEAYIRHLTVRFEGNADEFREQQEPPAPEVEEKAPGSGRREETPPPQAEPSGESEEKPADEPAETASETPESKEDAAPKSEPEADSDEDLEL